MLLSDALLNSSHFSAIYASNLPARKRRRHEPFCGGSLTGIRATHKHSSLEIAFEFVTHALINGSEEAALLPRKVTNDSESETKLVDQPERASKPSRETPQNVNGQGTQRPKSSKDSLMKAIAERNWKEAYQEFWQLSAEDVNQLEGWSMNSDLVMLTAKSRNLKATWDVYHRLHKTKLSYSALANVLATCIKGEDLIRALEIFRDMQMRGMKPNITTWCYLINSLSKNSRRKGWPYAKKAYLLWRELEEEQGIKADIDSSYYATGIMACSRYGKVQEAESILDTMVNSGMKPDARALNMLIKGYSGLGDLENAQRMLDRMQTLKVPAIASTYNTLIDAYSSRNLMDKAHNILELAIKDGIQPDTWAYSTLIKGYVEARDMAQVDAILDKMKASNVSPNVVTMTNLLDGCVNAGLMCEAEDLMQSMTNAGLQPNIVSYNSLLRGYAAKGDVQGAFPLTKKSRNDSTLEVRQAVQVVLLRMSEEGIVPRVDTYNTLMTSALSSGNEEQVPELFDQLVKLSLRPSSLSYTNLITAFGRMRNYNEASGAFLKLKERVGVDRIALNAFVAALANANRMEEAESQLQRAAHLAQKQGRPPPIQAYGAVVKAYTKRRDADAAIDCFYEYQDRGGEPDETLLDMVVTACVRAGEFKRALQFVRSMERAGKNINKARIKQTLEVVISLQEKAARKRTKAYSRNENLERFKFWLGLPNSYYNDNHQSES